MQHLLTSFARLINRLNEQVGKATAWLTPVLVLVVCFDVVARKLFSFSKIWIMDLEWHLFALIFLLAAGYSLQHDKHVRVDLFYADFSKKEKAQTDFWGTLIFLIPWCALVIVYSSGYALESWRLREGASEPGGLPARYAIKWMIAVGFVLLLLQALSQLIMAGLTLFGPHEDDTDDTAPTGTTQHE